MNIHNVLCLRVQMYYILPKRSNRTNKKWIYFRYKISREKDDTAMYDTVEWKVAWMSVYITCVDNAI